MHSLLPLLATFTGINSAWATPPSYPKHVAAGPVSVISQFQSNAGLENLAIRPNGNILATEISPPAVWEFTPGTRNGSAKPIAQFNNISTALGISSIGPDIFAVTTGNVSAGFAGQQGSFTVNILDYSGGVPRITKRIFIPKGKLVNKITALNPPGDTILVSDPESYLIWSVNTRDSSVRVALQDSKTMGPGASIPIAVNGIRTAGKYLYYINTGRALFNRVLLKKDGTVAGPFETIANITSALLLPDDFDVTPDGQAFVAGSNEVLYIAPDGKYKVISGGEQETTLAGITSVLFGNGANKRTLYGTTTGKGSAPGNTTYQEPGKVVAIPVTGL